MQQQDILINNILPQVLKDIVNDYLITDQDKVAQLILNQKEPILYIPYNKHQTIVINWIDSKKCGDPRFFDYALTILLKDVKNRIRHTLGRSRLFTIESLISKSKEDQEMYPIMLAFQYSWGQRKVHVRPLSDDKYNCIVNSISKMLNVRES
jgi:hypothetical protein